MQTACSLCDRTRVRVLDLVYCVQGQKIWSNLHKEASRPEWHPGCIHHQVKSNTAQSLFTDTRTAANSEPSSKQENMGKNTDQKDRPIGCHGNERMKI